MSAHDASNQKILLVSNDFGPRAGGIESFVIGLLERLPSGSCTIYTSGQGDTSTYDERWSVDHRFRVIRDRSRILLPTPRVIREVSQVISREGVTHLWFGAAAPLALIFPFLKRKFPSLKGIALTHGHEVWWAKIPPFAFLFRFMGRHLDQIGYLADYTKREISKGLRMSDREKLIQIAPGIDIDHFTPVTDEKAVNDLREQLGLAGKRLIISVGRLVHRKGQDRLIEALPAIRAEFPAAHLLLVGEGPYRNRLEELAQRMGVAGAVTFLGRLQWDQLPIHLSMAELFAMPSRDRLAGFEVEGLGIVYLEASSCALPVVVGRSGGAPDALIDGETGILVDGNDSASVAKACMTMLRDPIRAKQMGQRGREWVIAKWNWDHWAAIFQGALLR